MSLRCFSIRVSFPAATALPSLNVAALGQSSSEAMEYVKARLANHHISAVTDLAGEGKDVFSYAQALSAEWPVSLGDAALDLPEWSPFSTLPDADCLDVRRFDIDGLKAEVAHMQSAPGGDCIAVLDGATAPNISDILATSALDHECLFRGQARETTQSAAPWLIKLQPDNGLTRRLVRAATDPRSGSPVVPAMFLKSNRSLTEIANHFRRISRIRSAEDGRWLYFRFADSNTMDDLRASMTAEDARTVLDDYNVLVPHAEGAFQMRLKDGNFEHASRNAGFRLTQRHVAAFRHRQRARFAQKIQKHVRRSFPNYQRPFIDRLISVGICLCRDSGIVQQDTTAGYIMLSAHLGLEFPRRYERLATILNPQRTELQRKTMIHAYLGDLDRKRQRHAG